MSPNRLATSARVVDRAPLVLNSFAARDRMALCLASCCTPRLKGDPLSVAVLKGRSFAKFDFLNFKYFFCPCPCKTAELPVFWAPDLRSKVVGDERYRTV